MSWCRFPQPKDTTCSQYHTHWRIQTQRCHNRLTHMYSSCCRIHPSPSLNIISGAPNDGFLLNTLKSFFRISRVLWDLRGLYYFYQFGHPRGTWIFTKLQGIQYYFAENFRCNLTYYESENFSDSSLHHIFESENFRFSFCTKSSLTLAVKCKELNLKKS